MHSSILFLRSVISIDVSFLHGRYNGRLLVVVAYDVENHMLSLTFELIDKENGDNWG